MRKRGGRLVIVLDARALKLALAGLALFITAKAVWSERLTLATTYPAPVGVYNYIITTGNNALNTVLARNDGGVAIGGANLTPGYKLQVNGAAQTTGSLAVGGDAQVARAVSVGGALSVAGAVEANGDVCTNVSGRKCLNAIAEPPGSWCGVYATDGYNPVSVPCQGTNPAGGCPSGYTVARLVIGGGGAETYTGPSMMIVSCVKN